MKFLTIIGLITTLAACSATETVACPPNDQFIEPGSGPMACEAQYIQSPANRPGPGGQWP